MNQSELELNKKYYVKSCPDEGTLFPDRIFSATLIKIVDNRCILKDENGLMFITDDDNIISPLEEKQ